MCGVISQLARTRVGNNNTGNKTEAGWTGCGVVAREGEVEEVDGDGEEEEVVNAVCAVIRAYARTVQQRTTRQQRSSARLLRNFL